MSRTPTPGRRQARTRRLGAAGLVLLSVATGLIALAGPALAGTTTGATTQADAGPAASATWCSAHGAQLSGWTGTRPNLPICGPGPAYGGSWSYVDLPGPGGSLAGYHSATPGFQCVELADRWLAVGKGLSPVEANGDQVAANYHAAYPNSLLILNGSRQAVGHAPQAGDVISFSSVASFDGADDGHVAVVVGSQVQASTGDGKVFLAQQNVSSADYRMTLDLVGWRLVDPAEPADAAFQYPYAEWFHLLPPPRAVLAARHRALALERLRLAAARRVAPALLAASQRTLLAALVPAAALASSEVRQVSAMRSAKTVGTALRGARRLLPASRRPPGLGTLRLGTLRLGSGDGLGSRLAGPLIGLLARSGGRGRGPSSGAGGDPTLALALLGALTGAVLVRFRRRRVAPLPARVAAPRRR